MEMESLSHWGGRRPAWSPAMRNHPPLVHLPIYLLGNSTAVHTAGHPAMPSRSVRVARVRRRGQSDGSINWESRCFTRTAAFVDHECHQLP